MAITKLMHMKESKGNPASHLQNAINYILDVKHGGAKTDFGRWVGGNSGIEADEVFKNFMDTKEFYDKFDGRQGYHFAISFAKGETDAETCFEIMREFCEEFLKDNYDYVYAVHTDKGHMHGHIIFNSVARTTGLKYHYVKGDWEKYIQPITDKICVKHNLDPLSFEEEKVDEIIERYRAQLKYYKDALEKITEKRVKESYLYLFGIDKEIKIEI